MTKWKLKGCPRCSGDIHVLNDVAGWYEDCLQCGYQRYLPDEEFMEQNGSKPAIEYGSKPQSISLDISS